MSVRMSSAKYERQQCMFNYSEKDVERVLGLWCEK